MYNYGSRISRKSQEPSGSPSRERGPEADSTDVDVDSAVEEGRVNRHVEDLSQHLTCT